MPEGSEGSEIRMNLAGNPQPDEMDQGGMMVLHPSPGTKPGGGRAMKPKGFKLRLGT